MNEVEVDVGEKRRDDDDGGRRLRDRAGFVVAT